MTGPIARLRVALSSRPRDTRDTLLLLAVLAWTLAPQVPQVPAWCAALAYAALAWRARLAWTGGALPSRWVLGLALIGAAAGTVISHQSLLGRASGVTLLVVLAALKTLELRARRDATVVFFIGFFLVLANFLESQSLGTALAMGLAVWALLAALVLAHMPLGRPPVRAAFGIAARLLLTGLPLILALFVFFPRVAPLWAMPGDAAARTGLSEQMRLGDVAELAQDASLALRVQIEPGRAVPPTQALYFRGPVLTDPDGTGWRMRGPGAAMSAPPAPLLPRPAPPADQVLRYEMTVEPLRVTTLPMLETARVGPDLNEAHPRWRRHAEGIWTAERPMTDRLQVRAEAVFDTPVHLRFWKVPAGAPQAAPIRPDDPEWAPYLALVPGRHQRTLAWARELHPASPLNAADSTRLAQRLLDHIREEGFVYTLSPGRSDAEPVDEFWLDRRQGFCEHYASAFVVIMRGWGVPARIVTGYQGGRVNPVNGVLEVRQSDAHAWAEYWNPWRGWVRVDPTAAIAPERVQRTERLAAPRGLVGTTIAGFNPALIERLQAMWGAADHRWNQWVLGYSRDGQRQLLRHLGWDTPDPAALGRALAGGLGVLMLGAAIVLAVVSRRRQRPDPWLAAWQAMRGQLARRGLALPAHATPQAAAEAAQARWGAAAGPLAQALLAYADWRYAPPPARGPLAEARTAVHRALQALPS